MRIHLEIHYWCLLYMQIHYLHCINPLIVFLMHSPWYTFLQLLRLTLSLSYQSLTISDVRILFLNQTWVFCIHSLNLNTQTAKCMDTIWTHKHQTLTFIDNFVSFRFILSTLRKTYYGIVMVVCTSLSCSIWKYHSITIWYHHGDIKTIKVLFLWGNAMFCGILWSIIPW